MLKKLRSFLLVFLFCTAVLLAFMLQDSPASAAVLGQSTSPLPPTLSNDNFGRAKIINTLPYLDNTAIDYATRQDREPIPSCAAGYTINRTIWYAYTPSTTGFLTTNTGGYSPTLAVYTGSKLASLAEVGCGMYYNAQVVFLATAGTTYYFQILDTYNSGGPIYFQLDVAPPPQVNMYISHYQPSIFDTVYFDGYVWDPANQSIQSWEWDFGDGTKATDSYVSHQYVTDGDYTVSLKVTTVDGRTGMGSTTLKVSTHDVAITRLARPKSATVGQTKRLIVSVSNTRYPEDVRVDLYKSIPGGYRYIGFLEQFVDVKAKNKPTDFYLSYTFTKEDAGIGKVIFKAIANPVNANDAFPADNEFISYAVKVSAAKAGANAGVTSAAIDDMSDFITDDISNIEESFDVADEAVSGENSAEEGTLQTVTDVERNFLNFLPLVSGK
ncbi:MAG: PKD domain-containing protein [Caldilineaceae bacterium]